MATTYYVDDGGTATAPFDTYAKAANTLAGLITAVTPFAVDDEIHIGHDHAESTAASVTFAFVNGVEAQPIRIISTNTTSDEYDEGASITVTGTSDVNISSGSSVWYGVTFVVGDDFALTLANTVHEFHNCTITATDRCLTVSGETSGRFFGCIFSSADASAPGFSIVAESTLLIRGGSISMGSANSGVGIIVFGSSDSARVTIEDCDLSGCTNDMSLMTPGGGSSKVVHYRRCKLPSAYTMPTMIAENNVLEVESCSGSTSTNPFLGIGGEGTAGGVGGWSDVLGFTKAVVAQKRVGGASDGVNSYSWELNPNTNVSYFAPMVSPPMVYLAVPGSQTVTVHIANDVDLNDDECWMVVEHPDTGSPASPDHIVLSNTKPNPLATGSAITRDSGSTWEGAGTGTDGSTGQQKLVSSSFNPIEAGPVVIRIYLAKDDTMYVDPREVVT